MAKFTPKSNTKQRGTGGRTDFNFGANRPKSRGKAKASGKKGGGWSGYVGK